MGARAGSPGAVRGLTTHARAAPAAHGRGSGDPRLAVAGRMRGARARAGIGGQRSRARARHVPPHDVARATVPLMVARAVVLALALVALATPVIADTPAQSARALIVRYDQDVARLDRARDLLETALAGERRVDTLTTLSYVYFLFGDVRARTAEEKLAAYDRGREL